MNSRIVSLFSLAVLSAGPCLAAPHGSHWIVPARSIGRTELGPQGAATLARLPRPDATDSGMSQMRAVWVSHSRSRSDTLFIHTVSNGALNVPPLHGVTIDTIRVTSPWYRTRTGVGVGSTFAQIRRQFPGLRSIDRSHTIYDSKEQGIAFEFAHAARADTPSIAVMIHPRGDVHFVTASQVSALLKDGEKPRK